MIGPYFLRLGGDGPGTGETVNDTHGSSVRCVGVRGECPVREVSEPREVSEGPVRGTVLVPVAESRGPLFSGHVHCTECGRVRGSGLGFRR